ncbi:MAG: ACT domain-containing protein [Vampirovibrionales bacterium]|nr:ACT domain-containing protein [Vampirovibrionales bacterium]
MKNQRLQAVISGVGPDKPGIVAALTKVLLAHQANIEDSSMTRLAHEFALILIVTLAATDKIHALQAELDRLEAEMDMSFTIKPLNPHPDFAVSGQPCMISVGGHDRTGITHLITQKLSDLNVNISDLSAHVIDGDGGKTYIMMIEAVVPAPLTLAKLEVQLRDVPGAEKLDISVNALEDIPL